MDKTLVRLIQSFYWPGIRAQVTHHYDACPKCQLVQPKGPKGGLLWPMPIVSVPFELIGIDLVGPLTTSTGGH